MTLSNFELRINNCINFVYQPMIKALFFDIDGTLVSFKTHCIPSSTIDALTAAKRNGIDVYISTGRPYTLINNIDDIKHLIDGYITANGAYCFSGDEVISCHTIPADDVRKLLVKSGEMNFSTIIVGINELAMYNPTPEATGLFKNLLNINCFKQAEFETAISTPLLQLTPFISEEQERMLLPALSGITASRWYPAFTDMTAIGVNKAQGLYEIAMRNGYKETETMAFGDGGNDISIIKAAGIGIAMGNAGDEVKQAADFVTTSVDDNGIYNALAHFSLI